MDDDYDYRNKQTVGPRSRWTIGHHAFFLMIQSQLKALRQFDSFVKDERFGEAEAALNKATKLMKGAAVAMRFAGDFPESVYTEVVRPTMSTPNVGEGFSGDLARDHSRLVQILRHLAPVFKSLPVELERSHAEFERAVSIAYDAHIHVCDKFKGGEVHSLRMQADSARSSVEELERRKESRLQTISRCPYAHKLERIAA